MNDAILDLSPTEPGLEVQWSDTAPDGAAGQTIVLPWLWLRDHCQAPETVRPDTKQRQLDTFAIPADICAESVRRDQATGDVLIAWHDDEQISRYPVIFLHEATVAPHSIGEPRIERELWHRPIEPTVLAHDDLVGANGDSHVDHWVQAIARTGFALVESVPADATHTERLARRLAYVRETIYGGMWETEADLKHHDTGYTNEFLGSHTDGTYSHDAPGLLLFHVRHFDGSGGDSTLVDGFAIAEHLREHEPAAFDVLTRIPIPGQYLEPGVHLRAERPLIRVDQTGAVVQISYNNYDRAPFLPPVDDVASFYDALGRFQELADDPDRHWRQRLVPGTVLVFDNWRLLHGRYAYAGHRILSGCYFNHEDFESRVRLAAARRF